MSGGLPAPAEPLLRVVRGGPSDAELAALVAVLAARPAPAEPPAVVRGAWADPATLVRQPLAPGVGGWRRSGLPR